MPTRPEEHLGRVLSRIFADAAIFSRSLVVVRRAQIVSRNAPAEVANTPIRIIFRVIMRTRAKERERKRVAVDRHVCVFLIWTDCMDDYGRLRDTWRDKCDCGGKYLHDDDKVSQ